MREPLPVDIFATLTGGLTVLLILYGVVGVICAGIGMTVAEARGRSIGGCGLLCFFLGPLGVAIVMAMPLSTAKRLEEEAEWHQRREQRDRRAEAMSEVTRSLQESSPRRSETPRRRRFSTGPGSPTQRFLDLQQEKAEAETEQPDPEAEVTQRSREIAEMIRKAESEREES